VLGRTPNEEDFAEKFPFKEEREAEERERIRREEEEEKKRAELVNRVPQIQVKISGKKPEELAREKYEKEMKELQRRNKEHENYISLLIESIDRREL
jgi:hypothetical protein